MKISSKSSLKERSPDISLQHKNEASYKFSKKILLHLAEKRAGVERVNIWKLYRNMWIRYLRLYMKMESYNKKGTASRNTYNKSQNNCIDIMIILL